MIIARRFALLTLALFIVAPPARADEEPATAAAPIAAPSASVEELTQRVKKSLAVIITDGRDGQREALGTGFVIAADGLIATNFHVVGDGRAVRVQLADGRQFDATVLHAYDRALDLAVLRIEAKDLPVLELGNSDELKQGQNVVALGNPRGLKYSVVSGVVSSVREMTGRQMIQLAIPIEPGNSGGPLVDMQGRVQGVMTMKSLVTPNLGFALTINLLKPLLAKPNSIPMSRWLTIGALDPREWKPLMGARWRQRAGRIKVEGLGQGLGGRSLCLAQTPVPDRPYELTVGVHLNDERGAAGLAFCADGSDKHYGFYPTNGKLRLTRFEGPDFNTWTVLYDQPSRHYVSGGWNTLRVRVEEGKLLCFVNDQPVVELADSALAGGSVGLVQFRETQAQFRHFKVGREVPRSAVPPAEAERIARLVEGASPMGTPDPKLLQDLAANAALSSAVLRDRAALLEKQASRLRELAQAAHEQAVIAELAKSLSGDEDKIDLLRSALLLSRLDNDEIDVDAYCQQLERLAKELAEKLPADADEPTKLAALRKHLFEEHGFHGSRGDTDHRANSYLNEVLDDREGLPISLSVVYIELARRIGLNVVGIGLPGRFVVEHVSSEGQRQLIDVYEGAAPLSREEAEKRVATFEDVPAGVFSPMAKRAVIIRMLRNLMSASNNEPQALHRYLSAILAIDVDNVQARVARMEVRTRLERRDAALEDADWLLEHEPPGINLDRLTLFRQSLANEAGK